MPFHFCGKDPTQKSIFLKKCTLILRRSRKPSVNTNTVRTNFDWIPRRCLTKEWWLILEGHLKTNNPPTRAGVHSNVYYVASKIWFKIQNPKSEIQNPKSKIQNPKSQIRNTKSEIQNPKFAQKEMLHNAPKSKIRNPKSEIQNPKSEIQNPKSEIQNPKSPAKIQNLGRWGPHIKNCYITIQNPKSPKSGRKSLDFGLGNFGFWIADFGFWIPDFGFWGGPGDVPLGSSVTVPGGQRLGPPLVRQLYLIGLGEERNCGARTIRMGNICQ